jgi:hypothetical protein
MPTSPTEAKKNVKQVVFLFCRDLSKEDVDEILKDSAKSAD